MLGYVETHQLVFGRYPHGTHSVHGPYHNIGDKENGYETGHNPEHLHCDLFPASEPGSQQIGLTEDTNGKCSPNPGSQVDRNCPDGIVDAVPHQEFARTQHHQTTDRANHDAGDGIHHVSVSGDCHEPGQCTVAQF